MARYRKWLPKPRRQPLRVTAYVPAVGVPVIVRVASMDGHFLARRAAPYSSVFTLDGYGNQFCISEYYPDVR